MRPFGSLNSIDRAPIAPDTMANIVLAANTAEAFDWPTNAQMVRFRGSSTAGAGLGFAVNMMSTAANWPAADIAATTNSSALNAVVPAGNEIIYQVPSGSTGYSLVAPTSGIVTAEFWRK